jgi:hypothetical protein
MVEKMVNPEYIFRAHFHSHGCPIGARRFLRLRVLAHLSKVVYLIESLYKICPS